MIAVKTAPSLLTPAQSLFDGLTRLAQSMVPPSIGLGDDEAVPNAFIIRLSPVGIPEIVAFANVTTWTGPMTAHGYMEGTDQIPGEGSWCSIHRPLVLPFPNRPLPVEASRPDAGVDLTIPAI